MAELRNLIVSGNTNISGTLSVGGATTLSSTLNVSGITTLNKTLMINAPVGSYVEGIRIKPSTGNWSTILLGGADMPANEGTSANSWGLFNNNGNFYISRNGSSSSNSAILSCVSNQWSISNLNVSGESSFNGDLDIQSHQVIGSNGGSWISSRDRAIIKNTSHGQAAGNSYNPIVSIKTSSGEWSIGNLSGNEDLYFSYTSDADYSKDNNAHVDFTISKSGVYSGKASSANYASSAGSATTATTAYNIPTSSGSGNIWIS